MSNSAKCMWMRGGTSKGGYFLTDDLPTDIEERDRFLLRVMGSPDPRQIDGMGGADPLTSKAALVRVSKREGIDVDYLFLQLFVDRPTVTDTQNCGNLLSGVGPFALERGLVDAVDGVTPVTIYMENTGQTANVKISTPGGKVSYEGNAAIDGVPGTASPIPITFRDTAGSTCGALLPTGNVMDIIDDVEVTCIDNGMPTVIIRAEDMWIRGDESREVLEADEGLRTRLEALRLKAGPMMNLGDVTDKTVPKMCMVSAPKDGGAIMTRTFIPHRCHASIGVLGAVSVATACVLPGSPAASLAVVPDGLHKELKIEHPIGGSTVIMDMDAAGNVEEAAVLRTARKLFDGEIFGAQDS